MVWPTWQETSPLVVPGKAPGALAPAQIDANSDGVELPLGGLALCE